MASYHFTIKTSKQTQASANMRADYICREGKYGEGEKAEELLYKEHVNMPEWATDNPREFWEASELYEKASGRTSFREIEFALPNELNLKQQKELVNEFLQKHLGSEFVYSYAIHEKAATLDSGNQNPHVHILFCDRRIDGIKRERDIFFKRADKKQPERGGALKEARWNGSDRKGYLLFMREDCANLQNKYLKREGFTESVDHRTKELQYVDALQKGDLDRAELLESPAETHLGPKIAQKVARDLNILTAGITDKAERYKIRSQYWESRRETQNVYQLRDIRALKHLTQSIQAETTDMRGKSREAQPDKIAITMFWRAKNSELKTMKSQLALEKYRLDRAMLKKSTNTFKLEKWQGHYEERVSKMKELELKIKNRILTPEDEIISQKTENGIINVEAEKRNTHKRLSKDIILEKMYPGLTVRAVKKLADDRIVQINQELGKLRKSEKVLRKKIKSDSQIRLLAEWRLSKGLLRSIHFDAKRLFTEKRLYKASEEAFNKLTPPTSGEEKIKNYNTEKDRLKIWKQGINDLSGSIVARRAGWELQKQQTNIQENIKKFETAFVNRNNLISVKIKDMRKQNEGLVNERSEWRRINYALSKPNETGQFLQNTRSIQGQLQKAVNKAREERPKGRISEIKVFVNDDIGSSRSANQGAEIE